MLSSPGSTPAELVRSIRRMPIAVEQVSSKFCPSSSDIRGHGCGYYALDAISSFSSPMMLFLSALADKTNSLSFERQMTSSSSGSNPWTR